MREDFTISCQEYANLRDAGKDHILLDVRGQDERNICTIENDINIEMSDISMRYQELDDDMPIIVYCHSGIRSAQVTRFLQSVGYENVRNLQGGIDAWAEEVDSSLPRY